MATANWPEMYSPPEVSPMNCRILYLIGQLVPGGSERQLYYLLQAMVRERYRPAVAVWNYCEKDVYVHRIQKLGVPLYFFPQIPLSTVKLVRLRRLVRALQPEL